MQNHNSVQLSGVITKIYPLIETPAKVKVARFVVEHSSAIEENLQYRKVFCRVFCIMLGDALSDDALNRQVMVSGFLNTNSKQQLILHIQKIKFN